LSALISRVGVNGALLSWPIYEEGMLDFQMNTLPLLKLVGLPDSLMRCRRVPAKDVKAYVKRNKDDAADDEAICES
jgi:hypothetical protein